MKNPSAIVRLPALIVALIAAVPGTAHATDITDIASMGSCYNTCDALLDLVGDDGNLCDSSGKGVTQGEFENSVASLSAPEGGLAMAEQWCARHGNTSFTNTGVIKDEANPATASAGISCPVPVLKEDATEDGAFTEAECTTVQLKLNACNSLTNREVVYQCMAFKMTAPDSGGKKCNYGEMQGLQDALIAVDVAVAADCALVCAASATGVGEAAQAVCSYGSAVAGALEFFSNLKWKENNDVTQWVSRVGGVAGAGVGALGLAAGGWKGTKVETNADTKADTKAEKNLACASAALYAGMAVARGIAVADLNNTAKKACESIQSLTGTGDQVLGTSSGSSGYYGSSTSASGSGTSSSGSGTSGTAEKTAAYQACMSGGGGDAVSCAEQAGYSGTAQAATGKDAALLKTAGTRLPAGTNLAGIMDSIKKNGVGGTLSAMGAGQSPEVASALSALGAAAERGGAEFARDNGFGGVSSPILASLTGGRGSSGGGGSSNPFGGMFGGGQQQGAGFGGAKGMDFGDGRGLASENDIWHSNTDKNLFQIVSSRIEKVAPRLSGK